MPVYKLPEDPIFPHPSEAEEDGLLAIGGDLSLQRLVNAYANGIFPWFSSENPILWWSPDPRLVLFPEKLKVSKSLKRILKTEKFEVRFDTNFKAVIEHCSKIKRNHEDGTWINKEMVEAYTQLHEKGAAHSVETYFEGELVGGLYGVSLGKSFFGESMFHLMSDASKVAFYYLVEKIKYWNFDIIDAQIHTDHLVSLGAEEIPREQFLEIIKESVQQETKLGNWGEI